MNKKISFFLLYEHEKVVDFLIFNIRENYVRAVQPLMSLALRSPMMHVATKVACGGQSDSDSSSAVDFDGWIESEGEKKKGRYMSFGL